MRVFWGSSYYRSVEIPHLLSLVRFAHHCLQHDVPLVVSPTWGDALVERSRSRSATRFLLDDDADVWLSVDGDISFDPAQALQVCHQALDHDVVGGLYVTRSSRGGIPTSFLEEGVRYRMARDPAPLPVRYLAGGFVAVRRGVFQKLAEGQTLYHADENLKHFDLFSPLAAESDGKPIRLSEDWAFCERARQAGFRVTMNPAVRLKHYGGYAFTLEDLIIEHPEAQELVLIRTSEGLKIEHGARPEAA